MPFLNRHHAAQKARNKHRQPKPKLIEGVVDRNCLPLTNPSLVVCLFVYTPP